MCVHFRDGTSIVLSDDVGQIYFLNTGQGESQKDAKYDQVVKFFNIYVDISFIACKFICLFRWFFWQFFLGDYRPLIQDTQGYVLDQVVSSHCAPVLCWLSSWLTWQDCWIFNVLANLCDIWCRRLNFHHTEETFRNLYVILVCYGSYSEILVLIGCKFLLQ